MPHSYSNLLVHAVFSTKNRVRWINAEMQSRLFPYMGGICREIGATARLINGAEDHVHMLVSLPADLSVADCIRTVKANSSRWIHEQPALPRGFSWQAGYGAFTVSSSNEEQVLAYVRDQQRHHRWVTFQQEFVALLRKHGVAFDERFLWK
jgi:putative transposase